MSSDHPRPGTDEADRSREDWQRTQNSAGTHPGSAVVWLALMAALLGGFALMGAAFALDSGVVFTAGLLVSGLAFVVPLGLLGRAER
jgi:hypothetical protein